MNSNIVGDFKCITGESRMKMASLVIDHDLNTLTTTARRLVLGSDCRWILELQRGGERDFGT